MGQAEEEEDQGEGEEGEEEVQKRLAFIPLNTVKNLTPLIHLFPTTPMLPHPLPPPTTTLNITSTETNHK